MNNLKLKPTRGKRLTSSLNRFGQASFELLSDFLSTLNNQNKSNLENVSSVCGNFKDKRVVETTQYEVVSKGFETSFENKPTDSSKSLHTQSQGAPTFKSQCAKRHRPVYIRSSATAHAFLICEEFRLDPLVAYHAIEILERFMLKHIENLLSQQKREVCGFEGNYEDLVFQRLRDKFSLFIISSVQIASKVTLHAKVIDNSSALKYLQSVGTDCPKEKILESELLILKTLDFRVNVPNPLVYTETLLEVLGHNDPTTPVAHLHHLCTYVLQFVYLQRDSIYRSLLIAVTGRLSPTSDQWAKFLSVTEDCMLLGVGVIAVAAFIYQTSTWEKVSQDYTYNQTITIRLCSADPQVVEELALITGISAKSIMDFAYVTLVHIINNKVP